MSAINLQSRPNAETYSELTNIHFNDMERFNTLDYKLNQERTLILAAEMQKAQSAFFSNPFFALQGLSLIRDIAEKKKQKAVTFKKYEESDEVNFSKNLYKCEISIRNYFIKLHSILTRNSHNSYSCHSAIKNFTSQTSIKIEDSFSAFNFRIHGLCNLAKLEVKNDKSDIGQIYSGKLLENILNQLEPLGSLKNNKIAQIVVRIKDAIDDLSAIFGVHTENIDKQIKLYKYNVRQRLVDLIEAYIILADKPRLEACELKLFNEARNQTLKICEKTICDFTFKVLGDQTLLSQHLSESLSIVLNHQSNYLKVRNQLIVSNWKLARFCASKFTEKGVPFEDMLNEAYLTLVKAAENYENNNIARFHTYALTSMYRCLNKVLWNNKRRAVYLPHNTKNKLFELIDAENKAFLDLERTPTDEELQKLTQTSIVKIKQLKIASKSPISLEMNCGEAKMDICHQGKDDEENQDLLPIQNKIMDSLYNYCQNEPSYEIDKFEAAEKIAKVLKNLTHREVEVIKLRFGLSDENTYSLAEIGQIFKVSRERIRQIEVAAITKLQSPLSIFNLQNLLD